MFLSDPSAYIVCHSLWSQATQNNVPGLELIGSKEIQEKEPVCLGTHAIWSPETGIVDWAHMARHYATVFMDNGGSVLTKLIKGNIYPVLDPRFPFLYSKDEWRSLAWSQCCISYGNGRL